MSHHNPNEKVVYVGDSRVKVRQEPIKQPDITAFPGKTEAFIPYFLLKEWMVGAVVLVAFMVWVVVEPAPLGYPADPTNAEFIPMPDWYFLFLYQFLKYPYVSQDFKLLGTIGVPAIMFGALLLAPFLDTGKERRFYRRPIASSLMLLSLAATAYLTIVSWDHYQDQLEARNIVPEHHLRAEAAKEALEKGEPRPNPLKKAQAPAIIDTDDSAFSIVEGTCLACHGADMNGTSNAPSLLGVGNKYSEEEIKQIVMNGRGDMPSYGDRFSEEEINQLAAWLAKQTQ